MTELPDFYLASSEHLGDLARVRACFSREPLRGPNDGDYLLVTVDPPVIGQAFGLGPRDIDSLVLSPHYRGDSLYPISAFPLPVYVYRFLNSLEKYYSSFRSDDVEMIAWGELYETRAAAERTRRGAK